MLTVETCQDDTITRVTAKAVNAIARDLGSNSRFSGTSNVADVLAFLEVSRTKYELANAANLTRGQKGKHTRAVKASAQAQARREASWAEQLAHTDVCTEHAQGRECETCDAVIARWNRKDEHALAQAERARELAA